MSGNGSSYQKNGGGEYKPIESTESSFSNGEGPKFNWKKIGIAAILIAAIGCGVSFLTKPKMSTEDMSKVADVPVAKNGKLRLFDDNGRYVIEDFDAKPTWSGFLPGVAGYYGKPVWSFYVNRGQGIASFGVESKDYPIYEFNPANKAYQVTPFTGFRTFVRGTRTLTSFEVEPFSPSRSRNLDLDSSTTEKPKRLMYVGPNEMEIKEIDAANGLTTSVKYIVLPEEDFAALVRRTNFTNTGTSDLTLSLLDGLAKIEPVGGKLDGSLKFMGRTIEGWMGVYHPDSTLNMPFYKMSTEPGDTASVKVEQAGHYCLSFIETPDSKADLLPIVFDTNKVFGEMTSLETPSGFHASSVADILDGHQYGDATTSSAFAAVDKLVLAPGESVTIASFYGKAEHIDEVPGLADIVTEPGFVAEKFQRARTLINELTKGVETNTVNELFNGAVKQMFLDNSLRGGMPTILGNGDDDANYDEDKRIKVFHTFSRIHGDLERDYNAFSIEPSYFSQGPGNYRDIAQNRRDDVTFQPRVGSFNIQMFLSYIQADGYEPLTVEAVAYLIKDKSVIKQLASELTADAESAKVLGDVLSGGPFRPGQMFELVEMLNITVAVEKDEFINTLVGASEDRSMAVYGTGYWADHWDYYVDLIESYTTIYPDGEEALMYDNELRYFFSTATVKPRSQKYVLTLTFTGKGKHVLQLDSTYFDSDKAAEQEAFFDPETGLTSIDANWQRTSEGVAFKSTPIAKLFLLGAIKFAMRDAYGMGIEYEGGRPGWNDAMNGLPGMVGSGMPETYELYLLLKYVKKVVSTYQRSIVIPAELQKMLKVVEGALDDLEESGFEEPEDLPLDVPKELFYYWDVVAAARENYRNDVQYYFSGNTTELSASEVTSMIDRWLEQVEIGMERAMKMGSQGFGDDGTSGVPPSYFSYDITKYELNEEKNEVGLPCVNAQAMRVGRFPSFLEAPVRYMKTVTDDKKKVKDMYEKVLKSGLRDEKLKMYTLSASLKGQSYDMGRMMAFSPGWLENESIWTHMSYKYYLELIRGKLYDEFFSEMKHGGILPFMDPDVYGRSLMECSSFLASSAFPNPEMHGRGFLARLSGSTAEFMSMWKLMFIGPEPFYLDEDGELQMQLVPALPLWLFDDGEAEPMLDDDDNLTIGFTLFAKIPVTYHNSKGTHLYGEPASGYKVTMADGKVLDIKGPTIPTETAKEIRKLVNVESIDAFF